MPSPPIGSETVPDEGFGWYWVVGTLTPEKAEIAFCSPGDGTDDVPPGWLAILSEDSYPLNFFKPISRRLFGYGDGKNAVV